MIERPKYGSLPVAAALDRDWRGYHLSEKLDGVWHELAIGRSIVVGELMPDSSFYAFDLPIFNGADLRPLPKRERLETLDTIPLARPATPGQGEDTAHFIRRVLEAGGEGIVAAGLDGPWGHDVVKVKRQETHDCTVVEIHAAKQSVRLGSDGLDRGWLTVPQSFILRGEPWRATLSVGEVVEVKCHSIHASGKFREAQLLRIRNDKRVGSTSYFVFVQRGLDKPIFSHDVHAVISSGLFSAPAFEPAV